MDDMRKRGWRPHRVHQWAGLVVFGFSFCVALLGVFLPVYSERGFAFALAENVLVGILSATLLGGMAAAGVWLLGRLISSRRWWSWAGVVALAGASVVIPFVVPNGQTDALNAGLSVGVILFLVSVVTIIMKAARPKPSTETSSAEFLDDEPFKRVP